MEWIDMVNKQQILTVPNLLSLLRLLLIPVIVWLYCSKEAYGMALVVLILSALTDIADGIIARKFHLVSDFGKALDPIADKLTQIATMGCLLGRFPHMCLPLGILVVKEVFTGAMSLYAVKKSGEVKGADWHGKLCTVLLYAVMGLHMLWIGIPIALSKVLMSLCVAVMCLSGILYWYRNFKQIKGYIS